MLALRINRSSSLKMISNSLIVNKAIEKNLATQSKVLFRLAGLLLSSILISGVPFTISAEQKANYTSRAQLASVLNPSQFEQRTTTPKVAKLAQQQKLTRHEQVKIESYFERAIVDIDNILFTEQKSLKENHQQLNQFIETRILPLWDVEYTLKLLIGSKRWKKLNSNEIKRLKAVFVDTLHRYVWEGVKLYDGQRLKMNNIKFTKKNNRGLMTVQLEPIYLPSFNINFKIAKKNPQWLSYDVLVQGVSYVKMKKNEYRRLLDEKGFESLVAHLSLKNNQE